MKPVTALALGALAFCLSWGGWHLYIDHMIFHAALEMGAQQAQQSRVVPPPRPGPLP